MLAFIPICPSNRSGAEGDLGFVGEYSPMLPLSLALSPLGRGNGVVVVEYFCDSFPFKGKARMRMGCVFRSPWSTAEQHSRAGGFRRGLSEAQRAEFRSRPVRRATQGTRSVAKGGGEGRVSLVPFFSRLKKGTSPPGYPRHLNNCAKRTKLQNHKTQTPPPWLNHCLSLTPTANRRA